MDKKLLKILALSTIIVAIEGSAYSDESPSQSKCDQYNDQAKCQTVKGLCKWSKKWNRCLRNCDFFKGNTAGFCNKESDGQCLWLQVFGWKKFKCKPTYE
jgi:hypothetical protein